MAVYNKFNVFVLDVGKGVHQLHSAGHEIAVYLSNVAPSATLDLVKADLAEIATGNGYTGPEDVLNDYTEAGGVATLVGTDVTITAAGGAIPQFQHVILVNNTVAGNPLIGWWPNATPIDLADGESVTLDFGASIATFT